MKFWLSIWIMVVFWNGAINNVAISDYKVGYDLEIGCELGNVTVEKEYYQQVCLGKKALADNEYQSALDYFQKASGIFLFERPNFELFPYLALSHHGLGDEVARDEMLEISLISLKILTRLYRCVETETDYMIATEDINGPHKIVSKYHDKVAGIMCGAAYDYIYNYDNIAYILGEAKLVKNFIQVHHMMDIEYVEGGN